jgi:hypothetical protein
MPNGNRLPPVSPRQALLATYVVLALAIAWALRGNAVEVMNGIMLKAAAAFAVAKTINAALSMAQEASLSGSFIVGGSFHPAAFLDPVDDLVEQFAGVMLAVSVAAAVLEISLRIGGSLAMMGLLAGSAAVLLLEPGPGRLPERVRSLAHGGLLIASLGLVGLPVAVGLTDQASRHFLAAPYAEAERGLLAVEAQTAEAAEEAVADPGESVGFLDGVRRAGGGALAKMRAVADGFSTLFGDIVTMIAVFALQTVLLPLLLAWLTYRGAIAAGVMALGRPRTPPP